MTIPFTKMHGAGNDFVMIDNRSGEFPLSVEQVAALCRPHLGIGADGLIVLEPPDDPAVADARMIYYNADGSRAEMCGNGARCFTAFAFEHGVGENGRLRFHTDAGLLTSTAKDGQYTIQLSEPFDLRIGQVVPLKSGDASVHHLNTGVPHVVKFVDDVTKVDIRPEGSELRFHPAFAPKGANANFVQIDSDGTVIVRTYERGVEDETLACGTGVTAVGIVSHLVHGVSQPVRLRVAAGDILGVTFDRTGDTITNVKLTGPAKTVFTGTVEI
jgi:diaminopimelate epimerase